MLYWPHKDEKSDEDPHKYHILVEKNRNRGTNSHDIVMDFHPESQEIKSRKPANYSDVLDQWNQP
jgi:replicative DNA helicase